MNKAVKMTWQTKRQLKEAAHHQVIAVKLGVPLERVKKLAVLAKKQ